MMQRSSPHFRTHSFFAAALTASAALCGACHPASATTGVSPSVAAAAASTPVATGTYKKPPLDELRRKLTPLQFEVTQNAATEPPFQNAFWDNHEAGIYVDVVTGEPLFSSLDKFNSGTGWPSFTRPIEDGRVIATRDDSFGMDRTEVRSATGNSHLGHLFDDGPAPTGLRYCIDSASLRFIPAKDLQTNGYGAYATRFDGAVAAAPAATRNACATPPPGERPGCEATLDTVVLAGGPADQAALRGLHGVLETQAGVVGAVPAVRVVFDPKQIDSASLLARWPRVDADAGAALAWRPSAAARY